MFALEILGASLTELPLANDHEPLEVFALKVFHEPFADRSEQLLNFYAVRLIGSKRSQRRRNIGAHHQHAQPMRVGELEPGITRRNFFPQPPHSEIPFALHGVVKQDHTARRHLW